MPKHISLSRFLTFTAFLLASLAFVQTSAATQDTVFLKKRVPGGNNMIFIDTSRTSLFYSQFDQSWFFRHAPLTEDDSALWDQLHLMDSEISQGQREHFPKEIQDLAGQWYPVEKYGDAYYLYKPSDGMFARTIFVTDSALVFLGGDGADQLYYPLRGVKRLEPQKFGIEIGIRPNSDNTTGLVTCVMQRLATDTTIYRLDAGQALTGLDETAYLIRVEDVRKFPIIVNYSVDQKEGEVQFDGKGNIRIR